VHALRTAARAEIVALAIVVAIGIAARAHEVGYNLDGDELFSADLARQPFGEVIARSLEDKPHPPLHNLLLHAWITSGFGASEPSVRALSVLFSVGFLVVTYGLLRRFVPVWIALGVLAILALSPLFVYYGQQARPYALTALLSSCNLVAYLQLLDEPRSPRRVALWAASSALWFYAQYLAILFVACELALALLYVRRWRERLAIGAASLMAGAAILPWIVAAMADSLVTATDPLGGINWITAPTPGLFAWLYVSVLGDVPGIATRELLVLPLAALGAAYVWRVARAGQLQRDHVVLFTISFVVPLVVFALSLWGPKPVFASRQLLASATAFVTIVALCLAAMPHRIAAVAVVVLVAWTAIALPQAFAHNTKPPWGEIAAWLDASAASATVVAQETWVSRPLAHYRSQGTVRLWSELDYGRRVGALLYVCRPSSSAASHCSEVDAETWPPRWSLERTWRWGAGADLRIHVYARAGAPGIADVISTSR
jgi:hypothetical protein